MYIQFVRSCVCVTWTMQPRTFCKAETLPHLQQIIHMFGSIRYLLISFSLTGLLLCESTTFSGMWFSLSCSLIFRFPLFCASFFSTEDSERPPPSEIDSLLVVGASIVTQNLQLKWLILLYYILTILFHRPVFLGLVFGFWNTLARVCTAL